jgi:exodeoxyribonuclease-3
MTAVARGFGDPAFDHESRLIAATVDGVRIINTYVPNGNKVGNEKWQFKMAWLDRFADYIASEISRGDVIWMGDINIAREPRDVYDSAKVLGGVGHHPDEFSRLDTITDDRLVDVFRKFHEEGGHYTYWDFFIKNAVDRKLGWRIDHIYATQNLAEKCLSCEIDLAPRKLERPSDHTFVVAEFT